MYIAPVSINEQAKKLSSRYQVRQVIDYVVGDSNKLCVLHGLLKTGKSTIILQVITELLESGCSKADILHICKWEPYDDTLDIVNTIVKSSAKYIFVEDLTSFYSFMVDFGKLCDLCLNGRRVVVTSGDAIGLYATVLDAFEDRVFMVPVYPLTFYEHCKFVLGTTSPTLKDFTGYLQSGGLFIEEYTTERYVHDGMDTFFLGDILASNEDQKTAWISIDTLGNGSCRQIFMAAYADAILSDINIRYAYLIRSAMCNCLDISDSLIEEVGVYWRKDKQSVSKRGITNVEGFLQFLQYCGVIVGNKLKRYITIPFINYELCSVVFSSLTCHDDDLRNEIRRVIVKSCAVGSGVSADLCLVDKEDVVDKIYAAGKCQYNNQGGEASEVQFDVSKARLN